MKTKTLSTIAVSTAALAALAVGPVLASGATPAVAHAPAQAQAAHASHTITAKESEFMIVLSTHKVAPGKYSLEAINKGTIKHGLVINGPGLKKVLIGYVQPGKHVAKTVKLKKGKYDIYCPVPGHKMDGMNTHLTVS